MTPRTRSILFVVFVVFSLILHLVFFYFASHIPARPNKPGPPEVVFVNLPAKLPIVDISKPKLQERPKKASAQALYDSSVVTEQVADGLKNQTASKQKKETQKKSSTDKPKDSVKDNKKVDTLPKPLAKQNPLPDSSSTTEQSKSTAGQSGGDHIPRIKIGDTTYLNTEANPNLGYFVELKRRFSLTWSPIPILRTQIGRLPPGQIRVQLGISVDVQGNLVKVVVLKSSGIPGYDEEGIRTVRSSAPFSSPPPQFLDNGFVHMSWGFIVNR